MIDLKNIPVRHFPADSGIGKGTWRQPVRAQEPEIYGYPCGNHEELYDELRQERVDRSISWEYAI